MTTEWILCKLIVDRELRDRVKSLKMGFYGHTTRKYESLEKEIVQLQGCVPGYRNRGRQCRRWTDDIAEWTVMKINEVATAAEDRDHWRGILRAAKPFLWRKALNDDEYISCSKDRRVCHHSFFPSRYYSRLDRTVFLPTWQSK